MPSRFKPEPAPAGASETLPQAAAHWPGDHDDTRVLRRVVATAQALAGADAAAILLYERERGLFLPTVPSVAVGLDDRWLRRQGLDAAQSLALRAAEGRDIASVLDTAQTPELDFPLLAGERHPGAACAVPLEAEGSIVGVLQLYDATPRAQPMDPAILRPYAELAGLAISIAQARESEGALFRRLEALDTASRAVAAELSLDEVLQGIVDAATRLSEARYGALGVVGPDGYLTDFITTGISSEERERIGELPRGHGLLGVLIRLGQPVRVPDMRRDPRRIGFPPHHPPMTSLLGVPIRVRDEVVGDLYLTDKIGAPEFSEDDEHLVALLAAHAAVAIENARLYGREQEAHHALQRALQATRASEERLRLLAEAGAALASTLDYHATLGAVAQLAVPALADWCSIVVVEEDGLLHRLAVAQVDPETNHVVERVQRRDPDHPAPSAGIAQVVGTGRPVLVPRVTEAHLEALADDEAHLMLLRELAPTSYMIVPLSTHDAVLGAITLTRAAPRPPYDDTDLALAADLARRMALAITNARLHAQTRELTMLRERERIARDLHDSIIQDIYAGTLQLEALAEDVPDADTRERLGHLGDHFTDVIRDLRTYIQGLRARELEGHLLGEGITALAQQVMAQSGLTVTVAVEGTAYRLSDEVDNALLHIMREALSNTVKHAHATQATVRLRYGPVGVMLAIEDNGRGFDAGASRGAEHHGLRNLRARAEDVGGTFQIRSAAGTGTTITVHIPTPPLDATATVPGPGTTPGAQTHT